MPLDDPWLKEIGIAEWPRSQPALKEDAIRYGSVLLNSDDVVLPKSAADDEVETRIVDETKRLLTQTRTDIEREQRKMDAVLHQIEMQVEAPNAALKALTNNIVEEHQHHSRLDMDLKRDERRAHVAVTAEATRIGETRGPKASLLSSVSGFALGFAGVEGIVTAASFVGQTGTAGALGAVGLALTATATNIGGGGYLTGTVLLPGASKRNSSYGVAWVYRLLALVMVTWLVAVNFLLGHFRAASGDFEVAFAAFLANPFNMGDMTGLLLTGFGLILAAIWCVKFYLSQDSYLIYGALGEDLRHAQNGVKDNYTMFANAVRVKADSAYKLLEEAIEDAVVGHRLAKEIRSRTEDLSDQFLRDQDALLAKATETAMYRRSVIREMLAPHGHVPTYFAQPISYDALRQSIPAIEQQIAFQERTEKEKNKILYDCAAAKEDVERIVAQALTLPFGATVYPHHTPGGHYVKQEIE